MRSLGLLVGAMVMSLVDGRASLGESPQAQTAPVHQPDLEPSIDKLLPAGRWYPPNRTALLTWLSQLAGAGLPAKQPVAIFDWDNTAVFGDVEETLFQYGLDRLAFHVTPDELRRLLPESVNGVTTLEGGAKLADVRADLLAAYDLLWPLIQKGDRKAARELPAHDDFRAKVGWLYEALSGTKGIGERYAYMWITYWLAGLTPGQLQELALAAFAEATQDRIERQTWRSASDGKTGRLEYTFMHGLRPQPEIQELMRGLRRAGVKVYVVSASLEPVVEAAARSLGYPVDAESIYGVRLQQKNGIFLPQLMDETTYPFTYRQGKADLIKHIIGGTPVFIAGDSDTDFEMLTGFDSLQMRLVINRNKKSAIRSLYDQALKPASGAGSVRTLLQGRDENAGFFQPTVETTPLGQSSPKKLE